MTIPPADADRESNMRCFQEVHRLYVDINENLFHNELKYLSMGMSGDYADAVRAGATMVRVAPGTTPCDRRSSPGAEPPQGGLWNTISRASALRRLCHEHYR